MSLLDLDRYYTPPAVATSIVEASGLANVGRVLDSTCGDGSLLSAAGALLDGVHCLGMDVDERAIGRLRRKYPAWTVSLGDALLDTSWRRVRAARESIGCALALLNPPFSMGAKKGIAVDLPGFKGSCSVAMAHVLAVLLRAGPGLCCAIVPESLLFSELDECARSVIRARYDIEEKQSLRNSTFRGTRANAFVVRFAKRLVVQQLSEGTITDKKSSPVTIVRGGLPVFEAVEMRRGRPYVHSTDFARVASRKGLVGLRRVRPIGRGSVVGHVVLLPRVGKPNQADVRAVFFRRPVQLSDCVIALTVSSKENAAVVTRMISDKWESLTDLYHGTGARYVTVTRLTSWVLRCWKTIGSGRARPGVRSTTST